MTQTRPIVLLVDDEVQSLQTMERILDEQFDVRTAVDAEAAQRVLADEWVQVVVSDQRMPVTTGVELLASVRERWPDVVRIIISGYTDAEDIIDGVNRAGIYQYITKPWHPDNLLLTVGNACRLFALQRENDRLALENRLTSATLAQRTEQRRAALKQSLRLDAIVRAPGSPLDRVCEQVALAAPYDIPVLLTGESGTGKELFARALHYNSPRADQPFVAENCGALPDQLLESELFGHRKGAFTGAVGDRVGLFEQADGGTIFLDEIGDVSPAFQVKLLRVLQEREVRPLGSSQRRRIDVRVVAATNRDPEQEMAAGRLRPDLFYRLAGIRLHLPALRERPVDIGPIAQRLLEQTLAAFELPARSFTPAALECLRGYGWPGNVRELQNEIQRVLVMSAGEVIDAPMLAAHIVGTAPAAAAAGGATSEGTLKQRVASIEAALLRDTLARHGGNKTRAAEALGLSRVGLRAKLARYGLADDEA
ncbi:MAG: sigma-54 dependent transcriptional regulator [Thiohalocapsa sp.]|nr:sigma-54 dependent transcriptional regulator [Thiohalocapsa sp.]MCF7989080.1 sigma-54 dependent transcriptional regulator [Thiohalocapsa sp.]